MVLGFFFLMFLFFERKSVYYFCYFKIRWIIMVFGSLIFNGMLLDFGEVWGVEYFL